MKINLVLDFSNGEIFFDDHEIILKWKDNVCFKINDQINISFKYNNLEYNTSIETIDLAVDLLKFKDSQTQVTFHEHATFFFNCERIDKTDRMDSPKTRYYKNFISYYFIPEIGIKFKNILKFMMFLKIGENNWRNDDYRVFIENFTPPRETDKLQRSRSF